MHKLVFVLNGVLLSGVLTVLFVGSEGVASPVVPGEPSDLSKLEASVAASPDAENVAALASKYLEREQPGLAQAVLDSAPEASSLHLSHVRSRVALAQGRVDEALEISQATLRECEAQGSDCPSWLYAKSIHQAHVLSAMKGAGVQDPKDDRGLTQAVLVSALQDVRVGGL
ncbi:MAG: hypothetical protein HOW73_25740 [Polyangiaceae bacterium]|nr:hypothetical protein [Polyangiaceae bacterium]